MLYAFGFGRLGVVLGDLYLVNPDPLPGQEGGERGVRLELRLLLRGEPRGSVYAARPIVVDRPVWRVDLLEGEASPPGSLDRAHHHPAFEGWDPGPRRFDEGLTADPVAWVGARLGDLDGLLAEAGVPAGEVGPDDGAQLRAAVPEILAVVERLLERVKAGALARPSSAERVTGARIGWL